MTSDGSLAQFIVGRARVESTQMRKKRESGATVAFVVVVVVGVGNVVVE